MKLYTQVMLAYDTYSTLARIVLIGCLLQPLTVHAALPPPPAEKIPLAELQRFTTAIEQIHKYYVKDTTDQVLFDNAIRGMLAGLDPHSAYFDPEEFSDLKTNTAGKFGGLGIEFMPDNGVIHVISPVDDTPAARAGIQAGDLIIKINDTPVKGLALKKAVEMLRGAPGSPILLTILRKNTNAPLKIKLVREIIRVKSVKKDLFSKHYGYIRISQFQDHTAEDMIKAINDLKKNTLKGLILDLRNNPGGLLTASVKVTNAFLEPTKLQYGKTIVYTKGRSEVDMRELANAHDLLANIPIVVLINEGSASASEIVAGALQDHKRALIVGTQSFGKGSVQTVIPIQANYALKLTTALYFTPAGRSIQATGITPDVEIKNIKVSENQEDAWASIKESDLEGHLSNDNKKAIQRKKSEKVEKADKAEKPINDYQLIGALNILKGLCVFK